MTMTMINYRSATMGLIDLIERNCIFLKDIAFDSLDEDFNPVFTAFNTARNKECKIKLVGRTAYIKNETTFDWVFSLKRP